jgi:hypothetical protein
MKSLLLLMMAGCFSIAAFSQSSDTTISSYYVLSKDSIGKKFITIERESTFPGGGDAWFKYLQQNLNVELSAKYVKLPQGEKTATQTAMVLFIIDAEGMPVEVSVENANEVHPKLAKEAIRIIKESPRWIPAEQEVFVDQDLHSIESIIKENELANKAFTNVKSYKKQPISFSLQKN